MSTQQDLLADEFEQFYKQYYSEEIGELARGFPQDSKSLWVDYMDLLTYNADLADDLLQNPDAVTSAAVDALVHHDLPIDSLKQSDESPNVRFYNVEEGHIYKPGELRKDHGGRYVGIQATLERVTSTNDLPLKVVYECQRCGIETEVPQDIGQDELQEPYACNGCEKQGPFHILERKGEWTDYTKFRLEARPDSAEDSDGKLVGYALDDLIEHGGESGILGRNGEPVTVYGVVRRVQKKGKGENNLLFDHLLDARAIEFDRDNETVDVEAHKDEFTQLAQEPDAVDKFAESIAPELHATDEWEAAFEFSVAYLFGAPRIDIENGPTYRGDIHGMIISDFGMGKSSFKGDIEAYSPKCISKSATALSSDVGLTSAAVKDDFGAGQWTIKPGLLVKANGGHLILDELDKGPDDLTEMNDALEGDQTVDVEKAGKSVSYESKTGLLALGNPKEGRFDPNQSISSQLGINETLLSRFDGIITMQDTVDMDMDKKIADTFGKSYTEAQEAQYGDRDEFDQLDREVPIDVGKAWVKYARENVTPILHYDQFEELKEWYAEEVRQLNYDFGAAEGDGKDMPVPATVRELGAAVKMSIAFARVHLRDEVAPQDVERAKKLGKKLVKQNWDGEKFNAAKEQDQTEDNKKAVLDALNEETYEYPSQIAQRASVDEDTARYYCEKLSKETNPAKALEKNGKYKRSEN